MSSWQKGGEQTDCVSPRMHGWSETKPSWPRWKCEAKESVCCLLLYRHHPCRSKLTLFGSGMITYPLFVQCPSDTSRSLPAFAFISNTCTGKSCLCSACRRSFPLVVSVDRREAGLDKRRAEASHHWAGEHVWRAGAALRLHPHLLRFRYWKATCGRIIFCFFGFCTLASPELNYSETPVEFKRNSFWFGGNANHFPLKRIFTSGRISGNGHRHKTSVECKVRKSARDLAQRHTAASNGLHRDVGNWKHFGL